MDKILAIARNTIAQALRMKIASAVIVLLLILLPMMSMIMVGDGTLLGKLQTFSSYAMSLVGLLLSILTIAISTFTLSDEIKRQQIFLVVTKPVLRWQIIAGKFIGVVLLNVVLLGVFCGIIYGLTISVPHLLEAPDEERMIANDQFFTAREGIKVEVDSQAAKARVQERFTKLKEEGRLPETMTEMEILTEFLREEMIREQSVDPGRGRVWDFKDVRPWSDPNTMIFVRYKLDTSSLSPDGVIYGLWSIGDLPAYQRGDGTLITPIYNVERSSPARTSQEFSVPANAVTKDTYLGVGFVNDPGLNPSSITVQELEVLYKVGTFGGNFARAALLMLVRLIFLAALGITLTTWLSFPVAILACMVVFSAGLVNGFIVDSIDSLGAGIGLIYTFTVKPLLTLLPRFDGEFNPSGYIVSGRIIRWLFFFKAAGEMIGLKSLLLLAFGMLVFRRREVAKSSV